MISLAIALGTQILRQMLPYEPKLPELQAFWGRLSESGKRAHFGGALRKKAALDRVSAGRGGASERAAVGRLLPGQDRTSFRRWQLRYQQFGLDGLVDTRMGPMSPITPELHAVICTLRRNDSEMSAFAIVSHLSKHHAFETSERTVNEVLRKAGLARLPGPSPRQAAQATETRLELGGMKLVEAADVELGYTASLADAVISVASEATAGSKPRAVDNSDRDEYGRFLPSYNDRYIQGPDDDIGPGFASVEEKRVDKDMHRLHLVRDGVEIVERKLVSMLVSPLIGSGPWDGMRTPRGRLLEELAGFAYMPSTLDLLMRELKYLGVASTLWEVHARVALEKTRHWGSGRQSVVIYADGSSKGVWTSLFSHSCPVKNVGRVMPGLDMVCLHTGYGVPIYIATHSGHAPLVNEVPKLLTLLDEDLDEDNTMRILVIDAEGNSVPFLKSLEFNTRPRGWVTCLKGPMAQKEVTGWTKWAPYRDGDRIRTGMSELNDADGLKFPIRVVDIERRTKGTVTRLGASLLLDVRLFSAPEIADLYFARWSNQEAQFRAVNQAVGFKDVHGYGKRLVDNITVINRLDKLNEMIPALDEKSRAMQGEHERHAESLKQSHAVLDKLQKDASATAARLEARLKSEGKVTPSMRKEAKQQEALRKLIDDETRKIGRLEKRREKANAALERTRAKLEHNQQEAEKLGDRREIFQHDVELDSLFTLMKVGLVFLVTYVLREYLGGAAMAPMTFLAHIATLPARLRLTPQLEIVTFEFNERDSDAMALLVAMADTINTRKLRLRSGKCLRVEVDPPPTPARPPPARKRVNSGRWNMG